MVIFSPYSPQTTNVYAMAPCLWKWSPIREVLVMAKEVFSYKSVQDSLLYTSFLKKRKKFVPRELSLFFSLHLFSYILKAFPIWWGESPNTGQWLTYTAKKRINELRYHYCNCTFKLTLNKVLQVNCCNVASGLYKFTELYFILHVFHLEHDYSIY